MIYDWHYHPLEEKKHTILDCLSDKNIVLFELTESGLIIVEACDCYYGATLSANQLDRLIEELKALRKKLG